MLSSVPDKLVGWAAYSILRLIGLTDFYGQHRALGNADGAANTPITESVLCFIDDLDSRMGRRKFMPTSQATEEVNLQDLFHLTSAADTNQKQGRGGSQCEP